MDVTIEDKNSTNLSIEEIKALMAQYKQVSIEFEVKGSYDYRNGTKDPIFHKNKDLIPHFKDYDFYEDPSIWIDTWNTSNWGIIFAYNRNKLVGGAISVWKTENLNLLYGREDLVLLWDIRVDPLFRGKGVGSRLFKFVERWAKERGCNELLIETQTNNIVAIDFYLHMGCKIEQINENVYQTLPKEIQVILKKNLF